MHVYVREKREPKPRSKREQLAGQVKRQSIDKNSEPCIEPHIPVTHKGQWCKKMHTKLLIGNPRLPLTVLFKRKSINENRLASPELDVKSAGVLKGHPMQQSFLLNV